MGRRFWVAALVQKYCGIELLGLPWAQQASGSNADAYRRDSCLRAVMISKTPDLAANIPINPLT